MFSEGECLYWAKARCQGGWRCELAFESDDCAQQFMVAREQTNLSYETISYKDVKSSNVRLAMFEGDVLVGAYYLSSEPALLSRAWLASRLSQGFVTAIEKQKLLAGRADAAMPDKGAIVCSCMNIGANEIASAIHGGCHTVQKIGDVTTAGTNCGSCRAEINGMIDVVLRETKIAAE